MLVSEALSWAVRECSNISAVPNIEAKTLMCHALNCSLEQMFMYYSKALTQNELSLYKSLIARRQKFEPIAYIIGKKEFYGRDFALTNEVLIPRPETELLVDLIIAECVQSPSSKDKMSILELGTGSGAISVTLACELPGRLNIYATDISNAALNIAISNAKINSSYDNITFIMSDWYDNLNDHARPNMFNFIVSNPPYISTQEKNIMAEETLKFEPKIALYAGESGLEAYEKIISGAKKYLKNKGLIFIEIGYLQASAVEKILLSYGFVNIELFKDLGGLDRVIKAQIIF